MLRGNLKSCIKIQYYNKTRNLQNNGMWDKIDPKKGNSVYFSIVAEKNCNVSIGIETKESLNEKRQAL